MKLPTLRQAAALLALTTLIGQPTIAAAQTYRLQIPVTGLQSTGEAPPAPQPLSVTASPASLDFTATRVGQSVSRQVTLTNTGSEPETVAGISAPAAAGYRVAGACGELAAGNACSFNVVYEPAAVAAPHSGSVTVSFAGRSTTRTVQVSGSAVSPEASVSPSALVFEPTPTNATATAQVVTVANDGQAPLAITSTTLSGTNPGDFSVASSCPSSLAPGANCELMVGFGPAEAGSRSAQLAISTDGGNHTVALSGEGLPVFDPSEASFQSVVASPSTIVAGAASPVILTASVSAGGIAADDGTTVGWSATGGSIVASSTTTGGVTSAPWSAPTTAGTYTVTASIASSGASRTANISVTPDLASASVVSLVAAPSSIAANGTATAALTATVTDIHGNPVGAGIDVVFSTSAGSFVEPTVATDANSQAVGTLTSGITAGAALVTAQAASGPAAEAQVTFEPDASTARVSSVVADADSVPANGTAEITFTAQVTDANGNILGAGDVVTWTTTRGTLVTSTSTTDENGAATARVLAPANHQAGAVTVTARVGTSTAVSASSYFYSQNVVAVHQDQTVVVADGTQQVTFWTDVRNEDGTPAVDTVVQWAVNQGGSGTFATATTRTDATGTATNTYTAPVQKTGAISVNARTQNGTPVGASLTLTYEAASLQATVTLSHSQLPSNGTATLTATATVRDAYGNNPGAGIPISWHRSLGSFQGVNTRTTSTDANGVATVVYTAPAGAYAGTQVTIAAVSPAEIHAHGFLTLTLDAATLTPTVSASHDSVLARGDWAVAFYATVRDANGNNPGAGVTVTWTRAGANGTLTQASSTTDVNGVAATAYYPTPGIAHGDVATITARTPSNRTASATTTTLADMGSAYISLNRSYQTGQGGLGSTQWLEAWLRDQYGNRIPGITVAFTASRGSFPGATSAVSQSSGQARVQWTAPMTIGQVTWTATMPYDTKSMTAFIQ